MAWKDEVRAGVYINFVEQAEQRIVGGENGTIAIPLHSYDSINGTATPKNVYKITYEQEAINLFGADYIKPIKFALQAGAKEVLVYLMPEFDVSTYSQDLLDMRTAFDAEVFDIFVFDKENLGVVNGLASTKDTTTATQLNVDAGVSTLLQTDGTHSTQEIAATTFDTGAVASSTFYLDLNPDGTYNFATSHSATDDYITVAEVDTDSVGDISAVRDARLLVSTEQDNTLTWVQNNRTNDKHFLVVFGGNPVDDKDPSTGDARTTRLADDNALNLIVGTKIDGTEYSSGAYAPYIAGEIVKTGINGSITYNVLPVSDVNKRLTNAQIKTSLLTGSLLIVNDGEKVKIERGITTSVKKVRTIYARQTMNEDLNKLVADNYIGKVTNNPDGQASLISFIKAYFERLAQNNVISTKIEVGLDDQYDSTGDQVYITSKVIEHDSMEEIYITINA